MRPDMLETGETRTSRPDGVGPCRGGGCRLAGFDAPNGCNRISAARWGSAARTVPHLHSIGMCRLWA